MAQSCEVKQNPWKKILLKKEGTKIYPIVSKLHPLLYSLEDLVAIKLCMLSFDSSLIK